MARAPTTLNSFSAVAEPKRREVLGVLARSGGEMPVNLIVEALGWPQPQVSKHLGVLLQVGLVSVRRDRQERRYRINGEQLKPIHDWAATFERFWSHQLDRIKARAEHLERQSKHPKHSSHTPHTRPT